MRKTALCILALALIIGTVGCATSGTKAGFKKADIRTVAIAPVTGPVPIESARAQIANIFADNLRAKGYQVVNVGAPGTTAPSTPSTAVADATMNVNVTKWTQDVAMNARLVDNRTGSAVWTAHSSGKTDKLWKAAGGTTQPTAIGAVVSGPGGYVLSPKDEYVARHVAEEMFYTLPGAR